MTPISIIIPTYNGLNFLKRLVPSILHLINNVQDYELLVVDDGSKDGTEDYLKTYFPQIKVIALNRNLGFGQACNIGVARAKHGMILILNNDVLTDSDFISKVLWPWSDQGDENKSLFATSCKALKEDRRTSYHGKNEGIFDKGEIVIKPLPPEKGNTFFASGVMMVFRKEIFTELGGFDDLYHPFYWEDVDICYRALKKGYHILFEPDSVIYHGDQGTIVFRKKGRLDLFFAKMYARIIEERNQYLFTWKNILDHGLILKHIFWIPIHLILSFGNKDHIFKSVGFLFALMRLGKALKKRKEEKKKIYPLKDRQILSIE
jgi:GT2 family glycosyltransferase